jgi:hypothetical protein
MRTKPWFLALWAVLLVVVLGLATSSQSAVAAPERGSHLQYLVKFIGEDTFVDLGAPGFSQGDLFVFHDLIFTADGATQVGRDGGSCVIFDATMPEENCTLTFVLPEGEITVQFVTSVGPAPKPFAITGGTGQYRNVRGAGILAERGDETADLTFDLIGAHADD